MKVLVGRGLLFERKHVEWQNLVWRCFMQISLDMGGRAGFCGILFNDPTFRGYFSCLSTESGRRLSSWRNPAIR